MMHYSPAPFDRYPGILRERRTFARDLISQVAFWHRLPVPAVTGPRRFRPLVQARDDAIAAIYLNCKVDGRRPSLCEIARHVGDRNHTTILAALRRRGLK